MKIVSLWDISTGGGGGVVGGNNTYLRIPGGIPCGRSPRERGGGGVGRGGGGGSYTYLRIPGGIPCGRSPPPGERLLASAVGSLASVLRC